MIHDQIPPLEVPAKFRKLTIRTRLAAGGMYSICCTKLGVANLPSEHVFDVHPTRLEDRLNEVAKKAVLWTALTEQNYVVEVFSATKRFFSSIQVQPSGKWYNWR